MQTLLMGGQACVFYGAAEFSRDINFALQIESDNLLRLRTALHELQATPIAVPPFETQFLRRGHAIHFRCAHPEAVGLRVDVMSTMRGVDEFALLWERRTTVESQGDRFDLLALPDLVRAKKTQRDKDWPMIRRLVEAHYFEFRAQPSVARLDFWLRELRTPLLLREVVALHPHRAAQRENERQVLATLLQGGSESQLEQALLAEEHREREADRIYWQPLKKELETLRRKRTRKDDPENKGNDE